MPNLSDPVQSYWSNVMREAVASSALVLQGVIWTEAQRPKLQALQATHDAPRKALVDSLGETDQYPASTTRVYRLVAQQLQSDRALMTPDQTAVFDPHFTTWQQKHTMQLH